jgi:hypothetical protein
LERQKQAAKEQALLENERRLKREAEEQALREAEEQRRREMEAREQKRAEEISRLKEKVEDALAFKDRTSAKVWIAQLKSMEIDTRNFEKRLKKIQGKVPAWMLWTGVIVVLAVLSGLYSSYALVQRTAKLTTRASATAAPASAAPAIYVPSVPVILPTQSAIPTSMPVPILLPTAAMEITSLPTHTRIPTGSTTGQSGNSNQTGGVKILWTDTCDPRQDPQFCNMSSGLSGFEKFYGILHELNATLVYDRPLSYDGYIVVIAYYCSSEDIDPLRNYILSGGSVVVLSDSCSTLTSNFGITFKERIAIYGWVSVVNHPITKGIPQGENTLYMPGPSRLEVVPPAQTIIKFSNLDTIAVYDGQGTMVVIPDSVFEWDYGNGADGIDNNFVLWRNMLTWLIAQTRTKMHQ